MNNRLPWDITAAEADADTDGTKTAPATGTQIVRRLIVVMLLTAAALDLTRCGLVLAAARHLAATAGLVAAGLAAAVLTARTALGCQAGQRRAGWAALLIGATSAPQAAASGFRGTYTIPRHGHRCPGDAAGHHPPGDRGPDGPGHDPANPRVLGRGAAR